MKYIKSPTGIEYTFDQQRLGEMCHAGVPFCLCLAGRNYDQMCPDCRDSRAPNDIYSWCVCGPPDNDCVSAGDGQ